MPPFTAGSAQFDIKQFVIYTLGMKTRLAAALLAMLVISGLLAAVSYAQSDSVSTAQRIVSDFFDAANGLTRGYDIGPGPGELRRLLLENRDKAHSDLQTLNWTEEPGQRRFELVYRRVDSYMEDQMKPVKELYSRVPPEDKAAVEGILKRLTELRSAKLKELNDSLKAETFKQEKRKPVPVIDRSPYEKGPDSDKGIWER